MTLRIWILVPCALAAACNEGAGPLLDVGATDAAVAVDGQAQGDAVVPVSSMVSATCVDGMYREVPPTPTASIANVPFSSSNIVPYVLGVLDARYPFGAAIVRGCQAGPNTARCVTPFVRDTSSTSEVNQSLATVVHEAGHMYDLSMGGFGNYVVSPTTTINCQMGEPPNTFARSELLNDSFQSAVRACTSDQDQRCDIYARTYFAMPGSDQGFGSVLEEGFQYVNSLVTAYAVADQYPRSTRVSERDGIIAYLWYVERYLYLARTAHPDVYAAITASPCWRNAILTLWGRAWMYIELTRSLTQFEIMASQFMAQVMRPELLQEIQRIRTAHGCQP